MRSAKGDTSAGAQVCTVSATSNVCKCSNSSVHHRENPATHADNLWPAFSAGSTSPPIAHNISTRFHTRSQVSSMSSIRTALGLLGGEQQAVETRPNNAGRYGSSGECYGPAKIADAQLKTERWGETPSPNQASQACEAAKPSPARMEVCQPKGDLCNSALAQLPRKENPGGSALRRADDTQWICSFPGCRRLFRHKDSVRRHCGLAHPAWFLELEESRIQDCRNDDASYFFACSTDPASSAPSAGRDEVLAVPKTRMSRHCSSAISSAYGNSYSAHRCGGAKLVAAVRMESIGLGSPAFLSSEIEDSGAETRSSCGGTRRTDESDDDSAPTKLIREAQEVRCETWGESEGVGGEGSGMCHQLKDKKRRKRGLEQRSRPADTAPVKRSRRSKCALAADSGKGAGLRDEVSAKLRAEGPGRCAGVSTDDMRESEGANVEGAGGSCGHTGGLGDWPTGTHARVPRVREGVHDESSARKDDTPGRTRFNGAQKDRSAASKRIGCEGVGTKSFAESEGCIDAVCEVFAGVRHAASAAASCSDSGEVAAAFEVVRDEGMAADDRIGGDGAAACEGAHDAGLSASDAVCGDGASGAVGGRVEFSAASFTARVSSRRAPDGARADSVATSQDGFRSGMAAVDTVSKESSSASQRTPDEGNAAATTVCREGSDGTGSAFGDGAAGSDEAHSESSPVAEQDHGHCLSFSEGVTGWAASNRRSDHRSAASENVLGDGSASFEDIREDGLAACEDVCDGSTASAGHHDGASTASRGVGLDSLCRDASGAYLGGDESSGTCEQVGSKGNATSEGVHNEGTEASGSARDEGTPAVDFDLTQRSVSKCAIDALVAASADAPVERFTLSEGDRDESRTGWHCVPDQCSTAFKEFRDECRAASHAFRDEGSAAGSVRGHGLSVPYGVPDETLAAAEGVRHVRSGFSGCARGLGSASSKSVCDCGSDDAKLVREDCTPSVLLNEDSQTSQGIREVGAAESGTLRSQALAAHNRVFDEAALAICGVDCDGPAPSDKNPDERPASSSDSLYAVRADASRIGQRTSAGVGAREEAFAVSESVCDMGAASSGAFCQGCAAELHGGHEEGAAEIKRESEGMRGDESAWGERARQAAQGQQSMSSSASGCVPSASSAASDGGCDRGGRTPEGVRAESATPSASLPDPCPTGPGSERDDSLPATLRLGDEDIAAAEGALAVNLPAADARDIKPAPSESVRAVGLAVFDEAHEGSAAPAATSEGLRGTVSTAFEALRTHGSEMYDADDEMLDTSNGIRDERAAAFEAARAGSPAGYRGGLVEVAAGLGGVVIGSSATGDDDRVQGPVTSDVFHYEDLAASECESRDGPVASEMMDTRRPAGYVGCSFGEGVRTPKVRWNRNRKAHDVVLPHGAWWNEVHIGWFVETWWQHLASASTAEFKRSLQQLNAWAVEGHGIDCLAAWLSHTYSLRQDLTTIRILELLNYIRWQPSAALRRLLEEVYLLLTHEESAISETARSVVVRMESQLRSHSWAQPWTDEDASYFCGTERHLPSNDLPFSGSWVQREECDRWCHSECTNLTPAEVELLPSYCCPDCTSRAVGPLFPTSCPQALRTTDAAAGADTRALHDFASDTEAPSSCSSTTNSPIRGPCSSPVTEQCPADPC